VVSSVVLLQVCSLTAPRTDSDVRGPRPGVRGCTWPEWPGRCWEFCGCSRVRSAG